MSGRKIDIYLESVTVKNNGEEKKKKPGNNAIIGELMFPTVGRPSVPIKKTGLRLEDDIKYDFKTVTDENTDKLKFNFFDRILWREEITQDTKLNLMVTHKNKPDGLEQLLAKILPTVIGLGMGLVPGFFVAVKDALVALALESKKEEDDNDPNVLILGDASLELKLDDLMNRDSGEEWVVMLPLKVPATIYMWDIVHVSPDISQHSIRVKKIFLEESTGDNNNGEVILKMKMLD